MELKKPMAIDHPTLSVVVADRLRRLIAAGGLAPGGRLNERQLCDQLKVSRTPLREAYRILSAEGLVELTPKHGARVTELSEDDVANIFDVLAVNEGLAGRLAAEKATQAQLDQIASLHQEMMSAYRERNMARYAIAAKSTHDAINAAADNPTLRGIYLRLNAQVQKLRYQANLDEENWARSIQAHELFVAALLARDAAGVEALLREHVLAKKALAILGKPEEQASSPTPAARGRSAAPLPKGRSSARPPGSPKKPLSITPASTGNRIMR
jgi:DNA-binding GntR family transcriptional regulator